jgi:hypothetical protein
MTFLLLSSSSQPARNTRMSSTALAGGALFLLPFLPASYSSRRSAFREYCCVITVQFLFAHPFVIIADGSRDATKHHHHHHQHHHHQQQQQRPSPSSRADIHIAMRCAGVRTQQRRRLGWRMWTSCPGSPSPKWPNSSGAVVNFD